MARALGVRGRGRFHRRGSDRGNAFTERCIQRLCLVPACRRRSYWTYRMHSVDCTASRANDDGRSRCIWRLFAGSDRRSGGMPFMELGNALRLASAQCVGALSIEPRSGVGGARADSCRAATDWRNDRSWQQALTSVYRPRLGQWTGFMERCPSASSGYWSPSLEFSEGRHPRTDPQSTDAGDSALTSASRASTWARSSRMCVTSDSNCLIEATNCAGDIGVPPSRVSMSVTALNPEVAAIHCADRMWPSLCEMVAQISIRSARADARSSSKPCRACRRELSFMVTKMHTAGPGGKHPDTRNENGRRDG